MVLRRREPARLINSDSTDEFTLRLLESAAFDHPTAGAQGAAPARVSALMAGGRDLVAATHIREVHPRAKIRTLRPETKRITRAAAVGILLGTSLAAAVVGVKHATVFMHAATPVVSMHPPAIAPSARRGRPTVVREVPQATTEIPIPTPSVQPHEAKPAKAVAHDLGQELSLLDAAKAALSSGDPRGAIHALDQAARLPRRVLVPEATVLRVKALVALNRAAEARRLAISFVAQSPNSPVDAVLRDLVAPSEK